MTRKLVAIAGATAAATAVAVGFGAATAQAGPGAPTTHSAPTAPTTPTVPTVPTAVAEDPADPEEPEVPITGDPLARASAAALAHTGGGQVTETEVGDEEGYYEVEVTLADGSQVDVHLDERFAVLSSLADGETAR